MNRIITIGCEFGSGGREIGRRLSEELQFAYYDREIITEVANRTQLSEEYIQRISEHRPFISFPIHIGHSFYPVTDPMIQNSVLIFAEQHRLLGELSKKSDCIIVGRCADYILRDMNPFRNFVYADLESKLMITDEIRRNGKQANVSMFAFTATPKPTTIQLFGRLNTKGQREAFHIYSMKQAIEEGFILYVLQNYTTYDTFYQINKEIEDDPRCKTVDAKRQIARFVELHETNIAQRVEVIVEHFRTTVMPELGGMAKAMVITASRQGAVKYRQAFEDYTKKKGYTDIKALVAFSGKVKLPDDETEYSEAFMNGFPEDRLTKEFDKDEYQVLLVANKYQTGFDQPKLCAMYVLKKLKGVSAVQTLSRLNRICPPFEKKTFVLDFVNTYEDIKAAFAPYYTTTLLSTSVTPTAIYDLEAQIDAYTILDPDDIEKANELLYKGNISSKDKQKLTFYFKRAKNRIEQYELIKQYEIVSMMHHFVRFYEFLLQVSCFEDTDLHKKYNFITYLLAYINIKHPGGGYNLDGKIKATNFVQKKVEEHTTPMSLYALRWAADNWDNCALCARNPNYDISIKEYLNEQLNLNCSDGLAQCTSIEGLKNYIANENRISHRKERNYLYRAIEEDPLRCCCFCDYQKYIDENMITIDFDKWEQKDNNPLIRVLRSVQPCERKTA